MDLRILFEDKHLICVEKPFGVLSQGNEHTHSLCDEIASYLTSKGECTECYVIHRLDKTTGGAIVYAKTKAAAKKMSELVTIYKFNKTYLAVVCGEVENSSGCYTDLLYHDKNNNKTYVVKRERKGVKDAKLNYTVKGVRQYGGAKVSLVQIQLLTGRTHQIRVQFASRKHPLVGDRKYGSSINNDTVALWSHKIEFVHPYTKEQIAVTAQPYTEIFRIFE